MKINLAATLLVSSVTICASTTPAFAKDEQVTISKCAKPIGSIAVVDGDTQGWTKYGLNSPRDLIAAIAAESGCFTMASGKADFLMTAIAGDKEEVNQGVAMAKNALMEGALRSGAMGAVARVPMAGQLMGMFGGLGGKKKTIAAGLKIMNPGTGQAMVSGSGEASKSVVTFGGGSGGVLGSLGGYGSSKDGQLLTNAFVKAFNSVVSQSAGLTAMVAGAASSAAPADTSNRTVTAVDTQMYPTPAKGSPLRALRASTTLIPTGKRQGVFVEVKDNFGTQGWVSVEDLK